jgi:hypothetical protein
MNRRGTVAALGLILACLVAGCGSTKSVTGNVPAPTTSAAPAERPDALVGMWRVTGAAGEPADTVLRLASDDGMDLIVFRDCGEFTGGWQAGTSGAFVGLVSGFDMACMKKTATGDDPTPAWLRGARSFRISGSERELVAANGKVLAKLLPGGKPRPAPNLIERLQQPPTLDPATIQKLRGVPRPLPSGATPATATTILGTWSPSPSTSPTTDATPTVEFMADGSWKMPKDCNGAGGRWALGSGGELISTAWSTTLVGCPGPATPDWVGQARRAAVSGDVLTLYAIDGKVVARLTR